MSPTAGGKPTGQRTGDLPPCPAARAPGAGADHRTSVMLPFLSYEDFELYVLGHTSLGYGLAEHGFIRFEIVLIHQHWWRREPKLSLRNRSGCGHGRQFEMQRRAHLSLESGRPLGVVPRPLRRGP